MERRKIRHLTWKMPEYPERLKNIPDAPRELYYCGELPDAKQPCIAIVGARECSDYGRAMAKEFAGTLAGAGVNVVSGMARGIDSISQEAAILAGGRTYAVLGCGVDICYPRSSESLYKQIMEGKGGVISLCTPGTTPAKYLFPERNRIVAGLADALLVIEARQKSGTLITVDMALAQGKDVYAVPGRLTDRLSDGCNYLIRQGAGIALTPEDLLRELYGINLCKKKKNVQDKRMGVMKYMDYEPIHVDDILGKMREQYPEATFSGMMQELMNLCLQGKVVQTGGGYFSLAGPGD